MSLLTLKITEDHLKLLKYLKWSINGKGFIVGTEDDTYDPAPFGENNLYDAMQLILEGKPSDIDFLTHEDIITYTDEQKEVWDKLYAELPLALEIILYNGNFEIGTYAAQYHNRLWKKIKDL